MAAKKKAILPLLLVGAGVFAITKSNAAPPVYIPPQPGGGSGSSGGSQIEAVAKKASLIAWGYARWDATSATDFVQFLALLNNSQIALLFNYVILGFRDATTIQGMNVLASSYDLTGLYPL